MTYSNRDAEIRCECGEIISQVQSWRDDVGVYWITPEYCNDCRERREQEMQELEEEEQDDDT